MSLRVIERNGISELEKTKLEIAVLEITEFYFELEMSEFE
jgi:hypothetical protein